MAFKPQSEDENAMKRNQCYAISGRDAVLVIFTGYRAASYAIGACQVPKTAETTADINAQPLQVGIDAQGANYY